MCGRYLIEIDDDELYEIIALAEANSRSAPEGTGAVSGMSFAGGEIFPGSVAPVITAGNEARFMLWGYPSAVAGRRPHINARSETAATLRTFSSAMASRRCIVPASGYFEWKTLGKKSKEKYEFRQPDNAPIYMAGIYSRDCRFAILTRDAAPGLMDIHDRMPVILPKGSAEAWLGGAPDVLGEAVADLRFSLAG